MPRANKVSTPATPEDEKSALSKSIADQLVGRFDTSVRVPEHTADWFMVDALLIQRALAAAGLIQAAFMLGVDRQGFGFTVSIFMNGQKISKWFRPDEPGLDELHQFLQAISEEIEQATGK
jgi:predicted RNA-binding Zn ribbon-like protein